VTHNNELPENDRKPDLKHKKPITVVALLLALLTLGALGYEIFSPYGIEYALSDHIKRIKLFPGAVSGNTEAQKQMVSTYFAQLEQDSKNDKRRFYWHMKAAEGGDSFVAYKIARSYEHGYL
jgi:hypothetical protein